MRSPRLLTLATNSVIFLAGGLVALTHSRWPDLVIRLLITVVVMRGSLEILKDAKKSAGS